MTLELFQQKQLAALAIAWTSGKGRDKTSPVPYRRGVTAAALALGYSEKQLNHAVKLRRDEVGNQTKGNYGVNPYDKATEDQLNELRQIYKERGLTQCRMSNLTGSSVATVRKALTTTVSRRTAIRMLDKLRNEKHARPTKPV